ncbi:MAG TPA: GH92 family glycosyl hydrolase [Candidatus Sulfotelmatobacter sp.]|nr:GH92 family glycosyl hydrolase [Candidatus Sulfotelmatobacter sp.]
MKWSFCHISCSVFSILYVGALNVHSQSASASAPADLTQYASPICGTDGGANLFPGPVMPFGMIQWSPDTEMGTRKGGYSYQDSRISDFSVEHMNGAGCSYGEDFGMMPITGDLPSTAPRNRAAFAAEFSHDNEIATPGYYAVTFNNGIKTELTTTTRTGFGRFTYPGGDPATLVINAASDINGSDASGIEINPDTREVSGWTVGGYFCNRKHNIRDIRTIYFYAVFDRPFAAYSTWADDSLVKARAKASGTTSGGYITFDTSGGRTVQVKIGMSYVSVANAKANVEVENPVTAFSSQDFENAIQSAGDTWNSWLNKIQVSGGTPEDLTNFYSIYYHALISPNVVSDANGQYTGYDGKVHTTTDGRAQYGMYSGWDIYRSEAQLIGMLAPREASDMAQSLLVDYQQGGTFPRWGVLTEDSGVMMGDPAAPIIADFYAFGATDFDTHAALAGLVNAATNPAVYAPITQTYERDALKDYLHLGYVPEHQTGGYGNVSMTLEYASADFGLSQFAAALGDEQDSQMLLQHAQNWRNTFNPKTGYDQMRRRDGSWAPDFVPNRNKYDDDTAYVEGTAAQYRWMVPFDLKDLANMLGGRREAVQQLDIFHTKLNDGTRTIYAYLGNEPCLETPWIYDFWGAPYKTQATVRRSMTELYSSAPNGYPGNDDLGEMSSWYVFSALGMYPELPGSDILVLGSPLFPSAVVHLETGDVTITAKGAADNAPYVQDLKVNGSASNKPWLRYSQICHGATLAYDLSAKPNTRWGVNRRDAPPSYGK